MARSYSARAGKPVTPQIEPSIGFSLDSCPPIGANRERRTVIPAQAAAPPGVARPCRSLAGVLEPPPPSKKQQCCESEEGEKAARIGDGRDHHRRADRGIVTELDHRH